MYDRNTTKAIYVRTMSNTDIFLAVVVVVVVVSASEANSHFQNSLVFSSELPIRRTIYEGVDGTTQIC